MSAEGRPAPPLSLDHVAFAVPDVDAAARALAALGLPVGAPEEFEAEDTREVYVDTAPARLLLLQPRSPRGPLARHLARRGSGLHHLGLHTTDLPGLLARLSGWLACPATFRNLPRGGPAWLVRPELGLLCEVQPVAALPAPDGPATFRQVSLCVPERALGERLLAGLSLEGCPLALRHEGGHEVELEVAGRSVRVGSPFRVEGSQRGAC